ncbi:hypothetical protein [Ligilactobacillus salivarius]|uniref:hypothetical protein n=1 Tax=Ligilactobacillus salivarius TaxID=1624 RepID=UPI00191CC237|nr:hypothetical protein [Ligilactobacillus salivarius]MBL1070919.1 hypothetical protein [Ligilactobacillus salivarius]
MNNNIHSVNNKEDVAKIIKPDITAINQAMDSDNEDKMKEIHIQMDGRYTTYIPNFGKSMYGYSNDYGFSYEYMDKEVLFHNLLIMRGRLEGYIYNFPIAQASVPYQDIHLNVPVTNTNKINISLSFKDVRQQIEDMPGLTEKETSKLKDKINELEKINSERISRKKKWEKIKPIASFVLDKGVDVAIPILSLILQMKLGL